MGKGLDQTFLQRKCINGQQEHEKIIDITSPQGNANHNYNELLPLTLRMATIKKTGNWGGKKKSVGKDVEKWEPLCIAGVR